MQPLLSDSLYVVINKVLGAYLLANNSSLIRNMTYKGITCQGESSTRHLYLSDANHQLSFICTNHTFGTIKMKIFAIVLLALIAGECSYLYT